ncbi:hypothetical protein BDF14DRAFT_1821414 [Spinellus fusiger]|nr:hypothetical protein BDF14DRAFT_1821414 [Spinellus fusiger]
MSIYIYFYPSMPTYAYLCPPLFIYATFIHLCRLYPSMLTYAHLCPLYLSVYA